MTKPVSPLERISADPPSFEKKKKHFQITWGQSQGTHFTSVETKRPTSGLYKNPIEFDTVPASLIQHWTGFKPPSHWVTSGLWWGCLLVRSKPCIHPEISTHCSLLSPAHLPLTLNQEVALRIQHVNPIWMEWSAVLKTLWAVNKSSRLLSTKVLVYMGHVHLGPRKQHSGVGTLCEPC